MSFYETKSLCQQLSKLTDQPPSIVPISHNTSTARQSLSHSSQQYIVKIPDVVNPFSRISWQFPGLPKTKKNTYYCITVAIGCKNILFLFQIYFGPVKNIYYYQYIIKGMLFDLKKGSSEDKTVCVVKDKVKYPFKKKCVVFAIDSK